MTMVRGRRISPMAPLLAALLWLGPPVAAQLEGELPEELEEIGVTQKLDAALPLELAFVDEMGRPVRLGDYFDRGRPVLLSLVYYECPMLCTLVLDGMVDAMREIDWLPGREFEVVTVSIDPREGHALAQQKKRNYLESYGRREAAAGWHFLSGEAEQIDRLADAVGFRYKYLPGNGEFAHPATLFIVTPDGRMSRYLFGVLHDPQTLRLSLVEAGEGKIGSLVDKFLLYCYRYDAEEGAYAPVAAKIMRVGGVVSLLILGSVLLAFWMREVRQKRLA